MTFTQHPVTQRLHQARRIHQPQSPAGLETSLADAAAAYAVQDEMAALMGWIDEPGPHAWKAGASSLQSAPTFARLPADGVIHTPAKFLSRGFHGVKLEAEVAFRLRRDVTPGEVLDMATLLPTLFDAMAVTIELVDSRWQDPAGTPPLLKLADQQSHGALVVGTWVPLAPVDWMTQHCEVTINGVAQGFTGTHPTQDPFAAIPMWLLHATKRHGLLEAGTVVTTGTWCGAIPLPPVCTVSVHFDGIGDAALTLE